MYSKPVPLSGPKIWDIAVPAQCRHLRKLVACFFAFIVKKTKLDALRDAGKQREIYARAVVGSA